MRRVLAAVTATFALFLTTAAVEAAAPPGSHYSYKRVPHPDGIGKVYMGREIAWVMGFEGADWLDRPERVREEASDKLLPALKLKPGMVVADMGAGSGYHTFPMARLVGPKGMAYAVDIQKEMLAIIRRRMAARKVTNIVPVQGTITDPKLPAGSLDLILMVDVYHEFSHPYEMTQALVRALKPGGRLVFVEYRMEDPNVPIKLLHKMSVKQVKREMAIHPVEHVETLDMLPWQHIIVFQKKR